MARTVSISDSMSCPDGYGEATLTGRFLITSTQQTPEAACTLLGEGCNVRKEITRKGQDCGRGCGLLLPDSPLRKHEYLNLAR